MDHLQDQKLSEDPKKKTNKSHRVKGYDGYCDSSGYIHMRTLILNAKYLKLRNKSVYY